MEQTFLKYISENELFTNEDKILVGVSGGADSVFLVHLLKQLKFKFAIAHVNFKLRDKESDLDQKFVQNLANKLDVLFYTTNFETQQFAEQQGISIEMAARELRYKWFAELKTEYKYDYIATAHHSDDNVETYLLNIIRGTGLRGISGILPKRNNIIRPLLFTNKKDIIDYLTIKNIDFRTDLTNFENIYHRNKIRNIILPELEKINNSVKKNILENIRINNEIEYIYNEAIFRNKINCVFHENDNTLINIEQLSKLKPLKTYLYEFLKPFNFNFDIVLEIINSLNNLSGKQFFSSTHKLLKDREFLIISKIENTEKTSEYIINEVRNIILINKGFDDELKLKMSLMTKESDFTINKNENIALIDFEKINFPLRLRKWTTGDFFVPLGMKNKKKISDFFIDKKINIFEKEKIWILEDKKHIIWVLGQRIDNRVKITKDTKKILFFEKI